MMEYVGELQARGVDFTAWTAKNKVLDKDDDATQFIIDLAYLMS